MEMRKEKVIRGKKVNKDSREMLLASATHLFGRRGYHGTTIEDITRASGVSRGALYWHFSSKSELLGAVVDRLRGEFLDRMKSEIEVKETKASSKLFSIFKFCARFAVEKTDLIHCLRNLSLELSPSEDVHVQAFFKILDEQRNFILRIIEEAQKEGYVRRDLDANILAGLILAIHDGILLQWTAFRRIFDGRDLAKAAREVMLLGMSSVPDRVSGILGSSVVGKVESDKNS